MEKETELRHMKNVALFLFLGAVVVFSITVFLPRNFGVDCAKAISEAAMVGALADWFAVVALFRSFPTKFPLPHTGIIPKNRDNIADNLASFVEENFLNPDSLVALIQKHDPTKQVADWLNSPANARRLGLYAGELVDLALDLVDDERYQRFLRNAIKSLIGKVDLSQKVGEVFDTLTKDGRHQELLDEAIKHLIELLKNEETRNQISQGVIRWLKDEHSVKEKMLPTEWLGDKSAEWMSNALNRILTDIAHSPKHLLRAKFDSAVQTFVQRFKTDAAFIRKGEEIKLYLQNDEKLGAYVQQMWIAAREWLRNDLSRNDSALEQTTAQIGRWIGRTLAHDDELRASLNEHMQQAAYVMAPDFAKFLTRHISDTVKNWDAREMSHQIELNIGKDLQYIRINGTLVGGFIGLILFVLSHFPEWVHQAI